MKRVLFTLMIAAFALNINAQALYENFDATDMPAGWTVIDNGTNPGTWFIDTYVPYQGTGHATIDTYETDGGPADDWLISPQITVTEDYRIAFYASSSDENYPDGFTLMASKNSTGVADFTIELLSVDEVPLSYTKYVVNLNDINGLSPGETIYLGFHCESNGSWLNLDEFAYEMAPTEAFFGFESGEIPNGWAVVDGGSNLGSWEVVDSDAHEGTYSLYLDAWEDGYGAPDDWVMTNKFKVGNNTELSFWANCYADYPDDITIYASKTGQNISDFTITVMPTFTLTGNFAKYKVVLTDITELSATDEIYLGIHCETNGSRVNIDNIKLGDIQQPALNYAYAISPNEIEAVYDIELEQVDADNFTLKTINGDITFSDAEIDASNAKIVHLSGASENFAADNDVDELSDGTTKAVELYAGILPLTYTSITNGDGTLIYDGPNATFKGVITNFNDDGSRVWIQDATGAHHGVNTYDMEYTNLYVGDEILFYGSVSPFRNQTEVFPATFIEVVSTGNTPEATTISGSDISIANEIDSDPAEQYEGQLVTITGVTVLAWDGAYFTCSDDGQTSSFYIGNIFGNYVQDGKEFNDQTLAINGTYDITGIVTGRDETYVLNPRNDADIKVASAIEKPQVVKELNVYPNPVSGTAHVSFMLEKTTGVEFSVYDMSGKQIKTVNFDTLNAGENNIDISFDGIRAGNYLLRANVDGKVTTKMLNVR